MTDPTAAPYPSRRTSLRSGEPVVPSTYAAGAAGLGWLGLPVLVSPDSKDRCAARSVITAVGRDGRLADRSPMTVMRWAAEQPVDITVEPGPVVVARAGGTAHVDRRGHLRLPVAIRRRARIAVGDRVLVVADPSHDEVLVVPLFLLEDLIAAYRRSLPSPGDQR